MNLGAGMPRLRRVDLRGVDLGGVDGAMKDAEAATPTAAPPARKKTLLTWTDDTERDGVETEGSVGAIVDVGAALKTSASTSAIDLIPSGVWVDPCIV